MGSGPDPSETGVSPLSAYQWYVIVPVPTAASVNVTPVLGAAATVWLTGCCVIASVAPPVAVAVLVIVWVVVTVWVAVPGVVLVLVTVWV